MRLPSKYSSSWRRTGSIGFAARRTRTPNVLASHSASRSGWGSNEIRHRPRLGRGDEQRPDRRVGEVVDDVEQAGCGRGFAEALVQRGGDGHCILLLSLRTPEEAAWRAASSLEPSAAPMAA